MGFPLAFILTALALALIVALVLIRALLRPGPDEVAGAAYDLTVWRGQLAEVERDLARGTLAPADAERARTEISRRILEADRALAAARPSAPGSRKAGLAAAGGVALLVAGGIGLYPWLGVLGYPDLPIQARLDRAEQLRQSRPSQATAESEAPKRELPTPDPKEAELMERLRSAVAERPDDLRGHELLARNEAAMGRFSEAAKAQQRVIEMKGGAVDAIDYAALADAQILAAGGYVSPEAEIALTETLKRDPENPTARFYMGLMFTQNLRPDLAFGFWRPLLEDGPQDAPWLPVIREQIGAVADAAGVDYRPAGAGPMMGGPMMPGPDAAAVAAAGEMSAGDREAMIRSMVQRLNDRLASEGGSPEEWARLIGALGVLGETERARTIWAEAQKTFAGTPEALATVDAAAAQAGLK